MKSSQNVSGMNCKEFVETCWIGHEPGLRKGGEMARKDWWSECIDSQYLVSKSIGCCWGKDKKSPISREEDAGGMISVHVAPDRRMLWQQTRLMRFRSVLTVLLLSIE